MPELLEVEAYRRLAGRIVGRAVSGVTLADRMYCRPGTDPDELADALTGTTVAAARRRGKLLILDLVGATGTGGRGVGRGCAAGGGRLRLGMRFGMTGRLVLDDQAPIEALTYGPDHDDPAWDRVALILDGRSRLRVNDARRLGSVELDPDEDRLGPDAATVGPAGLRDVLAGSQVPVKTRLMDQARLAGLGNMLVDEVLYRAAIAPSRPAGDVDAAEVRRLVGWLRRVLTELGERGGSHTGDLPRVRGGHCSRDGAPLAVTTVGGRTTFACPRHQR